MKLKRYEIHIYDDVCVDLFNNGVLDKSINNTYKLEDLLNQQDKRIKELEEENLSLQEQSIRDNQNWIEETTQLKQQLAEIEKKNFELVAKINLKEHKPAFCTLADRDCEALWQVEELQKQLSEKDKEYQSFKKIADENVNYLKNRILEETRNYNQDKILFAVEKLEKVKETTECVLDNALKNSSLNQSYYDRLLDEIDNQIKAIKGEK